MTMFIIEHPTRGVLMDQDVTVDPDGRMVHNGWRSRFSVEALRSEGMRFTTVPGVRLALDRLPPRLRETVSVKVKVWVVNGDEQGRAVRLTGSESSWAVWPHD
ncbi:MAG TPA: hypothetical protein VIX41_03545 [Acidimicrobiales bacterium]